LQTSPLGRSVGYWLDLTVDNSVKPRTRADSVGAQANGGEAAEYAIVTGNQGMGLVPRNQIGPYCERFDVKLKARSARPNDGRFTVATKIRFINPDSLTKPPTYTQVVELTGPGRTVYISGQLATDRNGTLVSRDFQTQAQQVFENLKAALAAVGATFKDVIKINSYLADIAQLPILREVRAGYLNAAALPASTTLGGASFAREGALLEVEVVVALPARATKASAASRGGKRGSRKAVAKARQKRKSATRGRVAR
jgi:enamine deaminase RidA (YjgF/YER057c/UK114 family)